MAEVFLLEPLGGSDSIDAGSGDAGGRPASPSFRLHGRGDGSEAAA